jgi:hypothetical protein
MSSCVSECYARATRLLVISFEEEQIRKRIQQSAADVSAYILPLHTPHGCRKGQRQGGWAVPGVGGVDVEGALEVLPGLHERVLVVRIDVHDRHAH